MIKKILSKLLFVMNPSPTRGMMKFVKENVGGEWLKGAEIGVAGGHHVFKYLWAIGRIRMVYLVDPYEPYEMDGLTKNFSHLEKEARKRLKIFENRISWYKVKSTNANVEDNSLDFVYIDANHSYKSTLEDIEYWYPKVKLGGVIGGHDFSGSFPGVAKAVIEFAEKKKLKIYGSGADWWVIK